MDCVDFAAALDLLEERLAGPGPGCAVIAVNPEKMVRAQRDPALLASLKRAGLLIPDGIGVVLALRLLGLGRTRRVPGCELMPRICALAERTGHGVFLFGASPEINARAAAVLSQRFPRLRITGCRDGYVSEEETDGVLAAIEASGARVLFVALGSPRQELWMARHLPRLTGVRICQGVGGTFDVLAGAVKRAPAGFIRLNAEWLYRLLTQPSRILRQTALPRFAWQVLTARLSVLPQTHPRGPAK